MRLVAFFACLAVALSARADPPRPHVYLVVVDGLGADDLDPVVMPRLSDPALTPPGFRTEARAVMPTRTNPNHASLLSGVLPETHGITGNGYWDRATGESRALDTAVLLEAETLFTVTKAVRPEAVTVAAFSKAKLGRLFATAPGRQEGPDVLWVPPSDAGTGHVGVASDAETMSAFLAATVGREPDLAAINLSEVDRTAHERGPRATADARGHADVAIGRLVDDLRDRGRWTRSVLVVTADHGFDDVGPTPDRPDRIVSLAERFAADGLTGIHVVGDGGVAHVYADAMALPAERGGPSSLGWAASIAWREPGVAEVLARVPVPGVARIDDVHPEWALVHERVGDLLVVARPGFQFVDGADLVTRGFRGNHGSPREARVPLVIAGGALGPAGPTLREPPTTADIGATIGALVGLRAARRLDGGLVRAGRPLALPLR